MSQELELYPFETATLQKSAAMIIPPIFILEVKGKTGSLNPEIQLVNTGKISDGYLVVQVVGANGTAVGEMDYSRELNFTESDRTKGILIQGAQNHAMNLDWNDVTEVHANTMVGLFHLSLQSESPLLGAPVVNLQLGVDTINKKVSGFAAVTQPLINPNVCTSHIVGTMIHEYVMKPGVSYIRVDLAGYPEIHWPSGSGIGPVVLKNFSGTILFNADWSNGIVHYQYNCGGSGWVQENQKISMQK